QHFSSHIRSSNDNFTAIEPEENNGIPRRLFHIKLVKLFFGPQLIYIQSLYRSTSFYVLLFGNIIC
ncbi:hypothetical protein L9F63_018558, partial [Diploptera punctata]